MSRILLAVFFLLHIPMAKALESLSLDVASIKAQGWTLKGIHIALSDFSEKKQKLILTIDKLTLHKPFDDLNLANVRCNDFAWHNNELWCKQGRAQVQSKRWQSPSANFTFHVKENDASFNLKDLRLFGGRIAVTAVERDMQWQVHLDAIGLNARLIHDLLPKKLFDIKNGKLNLELDGSGSRAHLNRVNLSAGLEGVTLQTRNGQFATEDVTLSAKLDAINQRGIWQWRAQSRSASGGLYVDPIYLDAGEQAIDLAAQGDWDSQMNKAEITSVQYYHAKTGELTGRAAVRLHDGVHFDKANLSFRSEDLQRLSSNYIQPFLEQSAWQGLSLMKGNLNADFAIAEQSLTGMALSFNNLELKDADSRLGVSDGNGIIHWSGEEAFNQPSQLAWRQLQLGALPLGAARLSFLARGNSIRLLEKIRAPFLGGVIAIKRFNWQADKGQEPEVYFEGNLNNVSLEQLSKALNWTPLSGEISGTIPGIEYRNQTLKVGGELKIRVFDGIAKIGSLAVSDLFSELPVLNAEIEFDNLDMDQITRRFEFGGITGRLSGFVKNLTLENWKPVSFYAWLGTPDDDDSSHRISQKAVKNIASIGGGGASDLVSRSFLSLFDTFGYDKLGIGCYLHNGVCQLMGLEATSTGYYIIKGGGLPRIDVIGYNSRINWDVLMERLKRITTSDEVIIK